MSEPEIPVPRDPKHQKFADAYLEGKSVADAYRIAGYGGKTPDVCSAGGSRLLKDVRIKAYIDAVRQKVAQGAVMSLQYKRELLFEVVDTPLMAIDPHDPARKSGRLLKKFKQGDAGWEIEKLDPLKAIEVDNKLAGHDAPQEHKHEISGLLTALSAIGGGTASPVPEDRL